MGNREEKSPCHIAMVAKFLDDNKLKTSEFALFQTSLILFKFISFAKSWQNSLGLNPKEPYLSAAVFTNSIKQSHELGSFTLQTCNDG